MGMSDEEIIQRFKVESGNSVSELGKVDNALKQISNSTNALKKHQEEHGSTLQKLGKEFVGLGHHHASLRHGIRLLAESTGLGSQSMMTFAHSTGMLGPVAGAGVAAIIALKTAWDAHNEAIQKAYEGYDQAVDRVREFDKERNKTAMRSEYGERGMKAQDELEAAEKAINAAKVLRDKASGDIHGNESGYIARIISFYGGAWRQSGADARMEGEASATINREQARITAINAELERQKKYQDAVKPAQDAMRSAETELAGGKMQIGMQDKIEAQEQLIAAMEKLKAEEKDKVVKKEYEIELDKQQNELIKMRLDLKEGEYQRQQKLFELTNHPGAFATGQERSTFAENKRYGAARHEALKELNAAGDPTKIFPVMEALEKEHNENLKKIQMDSASELATQRASINAQNLRNQGDNFGAEMTMADAHHQEMLVKDFGNEEKLKLDREQYNAEIQKLTIAHHNEIESYTSNLRSESLRIKGDQYGAEREALEEWQRKELELHKDQASEIRALHDQRAQDITRREKEERSQILGGYATEVTAATLGNGAAGVQRMLLEHQSKQREYARTGQGDYAAAENQAFEARIHRMRLDSDMELSGKRGVGFMDLAGGWDQFASSLNKNPMEEKQLAEQQAANALLNSIDRKLDSRAVLVN